MKLLWYEACFGHTRYRIDLQYNQFSSFIENHIGARDVLASTELMHLKGELLDLFFQIIINVCWSDFSTSIWWIFCTIVEYITFSEYNFWWWESKNIIIYFYYSTRKFSPLNILLNENIRSCFEFFYTYFPKLLLRIWFIEWYTRPISARFDNAWKIKSYLMEFVNISYYKWLRNSNSVLSKKITSFLFVYGEF